MTYEEVFTQIKSIFMEADVRGEGAFYAEVKEGTLCVEPYEYYDRDAVFTCTADTLFKLASGKLDPIFAFTTGKLRVEGNLEKAMKLQNFVKK